MSGPGVFCAGYLGKVLEFRQGLETCRVPPGGCCTRGLQTAMESGCVLFHAAAPVRQVQAAPFPLCRALHDEPQLISSEQLHCYPESGVRVADQAGGCDGWTEQQGHGDLNATLREILREHNM